MAIKGSVLADQIPDQLEAVARTADFYTEVGQR
jgi:hypothetical protein